MWDRWEPYNSHVHDDIWPKMAVEHLVVAKEEFTIKSGLCLLTWSLSQPELARVVCQWVDDGDFYYLVLGWFWHMINDPQGKRSTNWWFFMTWDSSFLVFNLWNGDVNSSERQNGHVLGENLRGSDGNYSPKLSFTFDGTVTSPVLLKSPYF